MIRTDCWDLSCALILTVRIVPKAGEAPAKARIGNRLFDGDDLKLLPILLARLVRRY
jgi:hypothetical protein